MKNYPLVHYTANEYYENIQGFEAAVYYTGIKYSLNNLALTENTSTENIAEGLRKALEICHLGGINEKHHFRKIYIYDAALKTLITDWRMSRNGLNMMLMQLPSLNEEKARWLWRVSTL